RELRRDGGRPARALPLPGRDGRLLLPARGRGKRPVLRGMVRDASPGPQPRAFRSRREAAPGRAVMAYDEQLAERIRETLEGREGLTERKMFGGIGFMLHGNMCCGVSKDELILRLGPTQGPRALAEPHTRAFGMSGRPMTGMVMVDPGGYATEEALSRWLG